MSVINTCNSATTRGVMVSHYRAFMDAEEDLQAQFEEDMEYVKKRLYRYAKSPQISLLDI